MYLARPYLSLICTAMLLMPAGGFAAGQAQAWSLDDVAGVVTDIIGGLEGVITTETHIAFRTYRPEDLGAGFSLGY